MAQARSSGIVKILKNAFAKDPDLKKICISSSAGALKEAHQLARIFDNFPCLLEKQYIESLSERFLRTLKKLPANTSTESLLPSVVQAEMETLEKEIAGMGCAELLGADGFVDADLAELLEWKREQISQLDICTMLCAYVGAINAKMMFTKQEELIEKFPNTGPILFNFANKNYARWTLSTLKESKRVCDPRVLESINPSIFKEILFFPVKHPVVGLAMGGLAFGVMYGLFHLAKQLSTPSQTSQDAEAVKSMLQQRK
jgi:hypothetical protein